MSTCQRWWQDLRPHLCIWEPAPQLGQVCLERHAASSAPARHTWSSNHDFSKRLREYLSYVRSSLWIGILRMSWPKVALMISLPVKSSLLKLPSIWEQSLIFSASIWSWTSCSDICRKYQSSCNSSRVDIYWNEWTGIHHGFFGGEWRNVGHRDKKYNWPMLKSLLQPF